MVVSVEILRANKSSPSAAAMLSALAAAVRQSGDELVETAQYRGDSEWLMLFGVGAEAHCKARDQHVKRGGKVMLWDLGYFGRRKETGYMRGSIDEDHPQRWLDRAPLDSSRWNAHRLELREDQMVGGHIVLVGLGPKSRAYVGEGWERKKYAELVRRFPGRRIVYRPKDSRDNLTLPCSRDSTSTINTVLRGAELVVCRHSNVAVDAAIAGVPFEAEDGAAMWLKALEFTPENRLEFLQRLAWFQWRPSEAGEGWRFFKGIA